MNWTEEHNEILEDYLSKFYHLLFYLKDESGFSSEPGMVYHPKEGITLEIFGRDH